LPERYGEKLAVVLDNTLDRQFEVEVPDWVWAIITERRTWKASSSANDMVVDAEIPADIENSMAGANFAP
jgi:hypothetical protein